MSLVRKLRGDERPSESGSQKQEARVERVILWRASKKPFSFPPGPREAQIQSLVDKLSEPRDPEGPDVVYRIELEQYIKALGKRAVPALINFLQKWVTKRKSYLFDALRFLEPHPTSAIVPALSAVVRHPDKGFRAAAARALGGVCSEDCMDLLKLCLADEEQSVRNAALRTLIQITFSSPRLQFVVPFAAELIGTQLEFMHLRLGDFHARLIRPWVEFCLHAKACRRTCVADQVHDGFEGS
jgi:hypothetical protein